MTAPASRKRLRRDLVADGPLRMEIMPLLFGRARIIYTDGLSVFDGW